ncbi:hypothetical protein FIA58_000055 [Flavobacterium jejuense]|uniref:AsmA-like C-terminal domain-containing protein n=1 Tax=Flavobacterium jejuense TaxID=1544455 RepID=A0ABX0IQ86_9FLAO|nr:hypothetical protein [Flavobacterium jejuense]NHN24054.1 hypothetical protein [Flavobacterium jejuense]
MTRIKKIILFFFGIILSLGILNFGINLWIEIQLPQIINEKNDSDYQVSYEDIDLSLWHANIKMHHISVVPKSNLKNTDQKTGIYATVSEIEVVDFNLWGILFGDKIKAKQLVVIQPKIILYKNTKNVISDPKSIQAKVIQPFEKIILVSDIILSEGTLTVKNNTTKQSLAGFSNLNLKLEGIVLNEETLQEKIPFTYKNYSLVCDSLFYHVNDFYKVSSHKMIATDSSLNIAAFQLLPKCSRKEFVQQIPKESDLYTVFVTDIALSKMDWGFKNDVFFYTSNAIHINALNANIYRGKMPEDDLSKKKLYNSLLRDLSFDLKVDTLQITHSKLVYEEEKDFTEGPGKLSFTDFNMTVLNLQSGFQKSKVSDTKITVQCRFMEESMLNVDWSFNTLDVSDGFKIKGTILNFNTEKLSYFTKPYLNVIVKGTLDKVYFNFAGNDVSNKGDFALQYDNLVVDVYRNNKRQKINKFLSAIGNLFIKDDSDEALKTTEIEVERKPEKSFYNFLWISIAEGLKHILI